MPEIDRIEGRRVFGLDPAGYYSARPEYPAEVYQLLKKRCNLRPGTRAFEIGAGTGLAPRHLLRLGADRLLIVEPDDRLAQYLKISLGACLNQNS
jgi:protein-L-isoaspartate O-methyltransferase